MKRSATVVYKNTRSKRARLTEPLTIKTKPVKKVVSATHTHNYMINDTLVDWLKSRSRRGTRRTPVYTQNKGFGQFIMRKGIEFETALVKHIHDYRIPVVTVSDYITDETCRTAINLMKQGVPVLHSVPVKNNYNRTQGVIDLLVRSDWLCNLVDLDPLSEQEQTKSAPRLNGDYHYVVVDIKFSTLPLRADGVHILNTGHYRAYKSQLLIYTQAVGRIQGYTAPYAFIMGRRWKYTSKKITNHGFSCLDRLGKIDYDVTDRSYIKETKNAINWVRDVKENGSSWSISPPSRIELYPNMCLDSGKWNSEKAKIAELNGEMTNVWNVGSKHRNTAIKAGITSWKDPDCTAAVMNIGGKRGPVIDEILKINQQTTDKIRPAVVQNNINGWKEKCNEVYVDFETLSDIFSGFGDLPQQKSSDMIFMIGVGLEKDGKWEYHSFICKAPTMEEEYRIMDDYMKFMRDLDNPKAHYWHAEKSFWKRAENRQFDLACADNNVDRKDHISDDWTTPEWCDMLHIFKYEPIVIKGCFKFGLKAIAKSMKDHGMITASIDSSCNSGMMAMVNAWECYQSANDPANTATMKDISRYNEFDVKVLWEIMGYLRQHHM